MRIVIIGSGNVATVLGRKMVLAKHQVVQVMSRQAEHAAALANELAAEFTTDPLLLDTTADIYVLAISDDALYKINEWLRLGNKIVVHTAGSVPVNVLKGVSGRYGVLYPLQSLRRELSFIPPVPFLVDGNDEATRTGILDFAYTLSSEVAVGGDNKRQKIHLAAVIASNFTNHLYSLAQEYCTSEKVDFNMLLPLINEVSRRVALGPAAEFQTGPAIRNDISTIEQHLNALHNYPQLQQLYAVFSDSIRKRIAP